MTHDYTSSPNPTSLKRSRVNRIWAGVCGGIAERFGWDPILVRLMVVLLTFFVFGPLMLMGYILAWMVIPSRRPGEDRSFRNADEEAFWRGVSDRPQATFSNLKYTFMDLEDRLQTLERSVTSDEWRLRRQFRDLERE